MNSEFPISLIKFKISCFAFSSLSLMHMISLLKTFVRTYESLVSNLALVRDLERFDRHIDVVRSNYSHWTFQYYTLKENIEKNVFSKNGLSSVMYFKVDHMIFSKKGLTEIPRSAAL